MGNAMGLVAFAVLGWLIADDVGPTAALLVGLGLLLIVAFWRYATHI